MTTVLLVDDQPLVRAGVAMLLSPAPDIEVLGECGDGAEAVEACARLQPDVVLMDVRMPGMDGVEATRALVSGHTDPDHLTKVLVLTTFDDEEALLAILRAGASGFLLKHAAPTDLVTAVRHVANGDAWIDPSVAGTVISSLSSAPGPVEAQRTRIASLTPREHEIFLLLARGMSNAEISGELSLSEATVKTHVSRILMKLGCRDRSQAVVVAYESGIVRPQA